MLSCTLCHITDLYGIKIPNPDDKPLWWQTAQNCPIHCDYYRYMTVVNKSYLQTHRQWQNKQVSTNSVIRTTLSEM